MTGRDRTYLHGQLASVGIVLDPAVPAAPNSPPPAAEAPPIREPAPVDREEVRALLVAAGAPPDDLEWLVRSCPSIEDARGYRPPARRAWCLDCDDVRPCDDNGCLTCRGAR